MLPTPNVPYLTAKYDYSLYFLSFGYSKQVNFVTKKKWFCAIFIIHNQICYAHLYFEVLILMK